MSKSVLITGSARRLGRFFAVEFAKKGWNIIIHHHSSEERAKDTLAEILNLGVNACVISADLIDEKQIVELVDRSFDFMGSIDVLVNNAGIYPSAYSLEDTETKIWDDTHSVNLRAQFLITREFVKNSKKNILEKDQSVKHIVNIASLGAIETWKKRTSYNVSKSGVIQLTKSLALELAPNFCVNSVCPGAIVQPHDYAPQDEGLISVSRIPMQRHGEPGDVFDAVYFFSSCSPYITGQSITVDGGYHLSR